MSGRSSEPDLVLDCRGQRCPLPVVTLARRIGEVPAGGVIRLLADDPAAGVDVPAWCRMRGQEYLGESEVPATGPATADGTVHGYDVRRMT